MTRNVSSVAPAHTWHIHRLCASRPWLVNAFVRYPSSQPLTQQCVSLVLSFPKQRPICPTCILLTAKHVRFRACLCSCCCCASRTAAGAHGAQRLQWHPFSCEAFLTGYRWVLRLRGKQLLLKCVVSSDLVAPHVYKALTVPYSCPRAVITAWLPCTIEGGLSGPSMHNLLYRSNALFTVSTTVLGAMCLLTALTDLTHRPAVRLEGSLRSVDGLQARAGCLPPRQGHLASLVSEGADVLAHWRSGSTATTGPGCRSGWTWTWATYSPGTQSRRAP